MQCIGPPPKGLKLGLFNEESQCSNLQDQQFNCKQVRIQQKKIKLVKHYTLPNSCDNMDPTDQNGKGHLSTSAGVYTLPQNQNWDGKGMKGNFW